MIYEIAMPISHQQPQILPFRPVNMGQTMWDREHERYHYHDYLG